MSEGWSLWSIPREVWLKQDEEIMSRIRDMGEVIAKETISVTLDERFDRLSRAATALWGCPACDAQVILAKRPSLTGHYEAFLLAPTAPNNGRLGCTSTTPEGALLKLEEIVMREIESRRDHLIEITPEFTL